MINHPNPKIKHYLDLLVIVCAFGVIVLLAVEFLMELDPIQKLAIQTVNLAILLVFLIELLYNLYFAENKKEYLKKHWLDVVAALPVLEVFRASRVAGLARSGLLFGSAGSIELAEIAKISEAERITGIDRLYDSFKLFWHEKLSFSHRNAISLPLHIGPGKKHKDHLLARKERLYKRKKFYPRP